jgi:hypothetical protein
VAGDGRAFAIGRASASSRSERGIALVITLILLSVITFMAVAFLVLSRSQKGAVTTQIDQLIAQQGAEEAAEQAKALLVSSVMGFTNPYNIDILVSTNYISPAGFINSGPAYRNPTNVSYFYPNGKVVTGNDALQNIANLLYNPRVPVFITNRLTRANDFRYYLDLNRNGTFEPTGLQPVIGANRQEFKLPNGSILSNYFVGDPQWIGQFERPAFPPGIAQNPGFPAGFPHSATNRFVYRYAFLVVPASKTLDINYIFNRAKLVTGPLQYDYQRNEGVGSWEINLAALLRDLNTNSWSTYQYLIQPNAAHSGVAFDDARQLLNYRNLDFPNVQRSVARLYGPLGVAAIRSDGIDDYAAGPLMLATTLPTRAPDPDPVNFHWFGADSTNHFFSPEDLFDKTKTAVASPSVYSFTDRLLAAGATTNASTYDKTTFYRLLSALGSDSAPEADQININYVNVDNQGHIVPNLATSFVSWANNPGMFFTNVANKLLTNTFGSNLTISRIQVYPTNQYTPSVHRLLQLAANIYDAANARFIVGTTNLQFPTVFRPLFGNANRFNLNEVDVVGYEEVTNADTQILAPYVVSHDPSLTNSMRNVKLRDMVYGIPLVVGTKKGLPNFNELAMDTSIQAVRKLEFVRPGTSTSLPVRQTNQMYVIGISNTFGIEGWNSYSNSFPLPLKMTVAADVRGVMTNEIPGQALVLSPTGLGLPANNWFSASFGTNITLAANQWHGYPGAGTEGLSFRIPLRGNFMPLVNSVYTRTAATRFVPLTGIGFFDRVSPHFQVPHIWLNFNARLRFILTAVDPVTGRNRIVDYVNLSDWENTVDLTDTLMAGGHCGDPYTPDGSDGSMWCTNRLRTISEDAPTYGILNQIGIGFGIIQPPDWNSFVQMYPPGQDRGQAIDFFRAQFGLGPISNPSSTFSRSNTFYAPYNPTRTIHLYTSWQANDPMVHYTVGDLRDLIRTNNIDFHGEGQSSTVQNLGHINTRYEPWGGNPKNLGPSATKYLLAVKDPGVTRSDDWDLPTNRFPNIGWLGRVHRGTPWQTIYLKSPLVDLVTWQRWSGNGVMVTNWGQYSTNVLAYGATNTDAAFTHPLNDRYVLDLFTTDINENASRGKLSINQTSLAAWSALLSGVIALTNINKEADLISPYAKPTYAPIAIQPAGPYNFLVTTGLPPVATIVNAINDVRATNVVRLVRAANLVGAYDPSTPAPRGYFSRLGEVLAVPQLTVASPFLNTNGANLQTKGLTDEAYERIPQQVLGLLKADPAPRFVIYAYGQALKPAERSVITSGPYFGLCTNYQITAEAVTRTVVRLEGVPIHPTALMTPTNSPTRTTPPTLTNILTQAFSQDMTNLHAVIESFTVLPPD